MGEAKRRSKNSHPETDAKVVAVRDMRIGFSISMRESFMRVAIGNVRAARNAVRSEETFEAFMRELFATQKVVMVCYDDPSEPGGIGVVVAKGLDAVLAEIEAEERPSTWVSFVVNDRESAYLLGMEFGDMAIVTVPFDSDNDDEAEAALEKARDLAEYEYRRYGKKAS